MKKEIKTSKAPKAIGPYSQGICFGDFIISSGQLPINPMTGEMPSDIKAQTKQSLENLKGVLEAGNSDLDHVVKTTVFLDDMNDFAAMNEVYSAFFEGEIKPSRSAVEVAKLPKGALVEIEAIAIAK